MSNSVYFLTATNTRRLTLANEPNYFRPKLVSALAAHILYMCVCSQLPQQCMRQCPFRVFIIFHFYSILKKDLTRHFSSLMVILYQLNLCQLFYKLLKQPNYFGRFWQFMRRTRQRA